MYPSSAIQGSFHHKPGNIVLIITSQSSGPAAYHSDEHEAPDAFPFVDPDNGSLEPRPSKLSDFQEMALDDLSATLFEDPILGNDAGTNDFELPLDDAFDSEPGSDNDDDWNLDAQPLANFDESDDGDFLYAEDERFDLIRSHNSSQSDSLEVRATCPHVSLSS